VTLVLFDIDGTLLTTNGVSRGVIEGVLRDVTGRDVGSEGVAFSGRTDPAILTDMLTRAGFSADYIRNELPGILSVYANALEASLRPEHVTVLPGVHELLEAVLARPALCVGLLTGNMEQTAFAKLRAGGLENGFSWGAFGSDHADRNELPGIARQRAKAITGLDFMPDRTVIIGDTEHDIACSRHHGAWAVCVCTGRQTRAMLEPHAADILLDTLVPADVILRFIDRIESGRG